MTPDETARDAVLTGLANVGMYPGPVDAGDVDADVVADAVLKALGWETLVSTAEAALESIGYPELVRLARLAADRLDEYVQASQAQGTYGELDYDQGTINLVRDLRAALG